ncbi:MAG: transglutaminase domain-containing protein [Candidatus Anammoximicrobium sp.]|nr:transglutaminase domain-containing protein [Candidatus Anammoximicrobium sp.]
MRTWPFYAALAIVLSTGSLAPAQLGQPKPAEDVRLDKQLTQRWQVGVRINAVGGPCAGLRGSIPVPAEWPEQQVRVVNEEVSPLVSRVTYRDLGGVRQMQFSIPQLPPGELATALVTFEITRSSVLPPENTAQYQIPKNLPVAIRFDLGISPAIECRHPAIRAKAKELVADKESAWKQVEAIYDWVRDNVKHQDGPLKGAAASLREGSGSRDDLTCLFIALCRASGVPARTVFVVDNVYAEFYLQDEAGQGSWFPCQVAGTREFGGMSDHRPILQKGDHLRVPDEHKDPQRFVAEFLTGKGGRGGRPQVEFVRKLLPAN